MSTSRTVTFEYGKSPAEVAALLQDPIYLRSRSEAAGERNIVVKVEPGPHGTRVTVSREKNIDVPAFARAVIGNASKAVESTVWRADGDRWLAEYTVEISGLPIKTRGTSVLSPSGGNGCKYVSTFEATVRIPLVGGRIEALVADGLVEQLTANAERNAAALARDNENPAHSYIDALRDAGVASKG